MDYVGTHESILPTLAHVCQRTNRTHKCFRPYIPKLVIWVMLISIYRDRCDQRETGLHRGQPRFSSGFCTWEYFLYWDGAWGWHFLMAIHDAYVIAKANRDPWSGAILHYCHCAKTSKYRAPLHRGFRLYKYITILLQITIMAGTEKFRSICYLCWRWSLRAKLSGISHHDTISCVRGIVTGSVGTLSHQHAMAKEGEKILTYTCKLV